MKSLFDRVSIKCSRLTTTSYSTSFSIGIWCLEKSIRNPIYSIYGFVRLADEIVDSFHDYDKEELLTRFRKDTFVAIEEKISLNPILNSFQEIVNKYKIDHKLISLFLRSMEMDLKRKEYDADTFREYVLGSAEVVGLMCLQVFCDGDRCNYERLAPYAMKLGSAFQKVNFLRDLNDDFYEMGRSYFPDIELNHLSESNKRLIEQSIQADFNAAYAGIQQLPRSCRFGVYVAYIYYLALFRKIRNTPSEKILKSRIRISNSQKAGLLAYSYLMNQLRML